MRRDFCSSCFADLPPAGNCPYCVAAPAPDNADILAPGTILAGKYRIGRLLGRGGFGATYLTLDENLQVRVAVKEFFPMGMAGRASGSTQVQPYNTRAQDYRLGLEGFLFEARTLAQFRGHAVIISVLDFFPENGTGYMVMEYVNGVTLLRYADDRQVIEPLTALRLLTPVVDALRACHAVGLIHRDIAPDNIFLTVDNTVKLLDFGAARQLLGERSQSLDSILKPGYAPIEQYASRGQGPWTDVYALTATLYRIITGVRPPSAADRAIADAELVMPAAMGIALPTGMEAFITKGMAMSKPDRFQDMDAFRAALLPFLTGGAAPPQPRGAPSQKVKTAPPAGGLPAGPGVQGGRGAAGPGGQPDRARPAAPPWRLNGLVAGGAGGVLALLALAWFVLTRPAALVSATLAAPAASPAAGAPAQQLIAQSPASLSPATSMQNQIDAARAALSDANQLLGNLIEEQNEIAKANATVTALQSLPGYQQQIAQAQAQVSYNQSEFAQDEDSYFADLQKLAAMPAPAAAIALTKLTDLAASNATASANLTMLSRHLDAVRAGTLTDGQISNDIQQRLQTISGATP